MTDRKDTAKKPGRITLSRRQWTIAAVIVAAAVLTVVVLVTRGPSPDVVATVNGHDIKRQDVAIMQVIMIMQNPRANVDRENALEQVIAEAVTYEEAERGGYALVRDEAEQRLLQEIADRGQTRDKTEQQLEMYGLSWEEYLNYYQRHVAIESYLDDTVEVPAPTEEQAREFYEEYMRLFPEETRTFEEMEAEVLESVEWLNHQSALREHVDELIEQARIRRYT